MRRAWLVVLMLAVILGLSAGCGGQTPAAIKSQIDFLHTVISIGVKESSQITDPMQRADKAVRALKRAEPHAKNLLRWAEGKDVNDGG